MWGMRDRGALKDSQEFDPGYRVARSDFYLRVWGKRSQFCPYVAAVG